MKLIGLGASSCITKISNVFTFLKSFGRHLVTWTTSVNMGNLEYAKIPQGNDFLDCPERKTFSTR